MDQYSPIFVVEEATSSKDRMPFDALFTVFQHQCWKNLAEHAYAGAFGGGDAQPGLGHGRKQPHSPTVFNDTILPPVFGLVITSILAVSSRSTLINKVPRF